MANTPQAKKRIRRNQRRAEINGARVSRIRTFVKQVETAIDGRRQGQARSRLCRRSQPELGARRLEGRPSQEYSSAEIFAPDHAVSPPSAKSLRGAL